jgi:sugar lactone lactonase YvrE
MTRSPLLQSAVAVLLVVAAGLAAGAQNPSLPNPYRESENWAKLPAGAKPEGVVGAGSIIEVDPAANGDIWVFRRADPPILRVNPSGTVVKAFGDGLFVQAHGMAVDREGSVWVTDAQPKDGKGNQVFKFSPDGRLLMTLGKAGVAGSGTDVFSGACDVVVAPNGDIFVADGHVDGVPVNRIMKFSKDGTFIKAWGTRGSGPGEFNLPHGIAMDSRGRIFVADRGNNRIQIFDQDGRFVDQWRQFGRPSDVFIDADDTMYVADAQSNSRINPGFTRGIVIGSARDGTVSALVPFVGPDPEKTNNAGFEAVATDINGNLFGAEVTSQTLRRYVKR